MGEIKHTRIKSLYGDIKGLLSQIPQSDQAIFTDVFIVNGFNSAIDDLSKIAETDYSRYKITNEAIAGGFSGKYYDSKIVRAQLGRVISRLEEEYDFGKNFIERPATNIAIFNKNQNEISLQINYTINDLIGNTDDEEGKKQLTELKDELEKPTKNWENIKKILIWILNFSKDLFLEILPIILKSFKT